MAGRGEVDFWVERGCSGLLVVIPGSQKILGTEGLAAGWLRGPTGRRGKDRVRVKASDGCPEMKKKKTYDHSSRRPIRPSTSEFSPLSAVSALFLGPRLLERA